MDPVGAAASIIGLIEGTYRLVDFLSDLKDGGKERMKLLAEVSYMACTLDSLKEKLDQNCPQQGLLTLVKAGGPLDQCRSIVVTLTKELTLKAGIGGRVAQRLSWSFKKEDVHMAVEKLHRIQTTVAQQITLAMTEQIQYDSATARELLHDQHEQRIRNWLSPLNFVAQQTAIYENHCSGTGARFLQSAQFDAWRKSSKSIMWCKGPPGAGKTYLASLIVHELQQGSRAELDIVLVVYCRYDDPNCQSVANIVGDLLKQCLKGRRVPDGLAQLFRTHSQADTRPTYEALLPLLYEQLESYRKCYIIIDALDELANPSDRSLLVATLRPLLATGGTGGFASQRFRRNSINRSAQVATSLIVMSRDLEDIKAAVESINDCNCRVGTTLGQCSLCEGHPGMGGRVNSFVYDVSADQEEMRRYIEWRIENDISLRILVKKKDGLLDHVLDAVLHGAGSMFLMAKLTIDAIATCLTIRDLKLSLRQIANGLHVAYDATIQRILCQGEGRSRRAFKVMNSMLLAQRPLTSAEMEHAVSIEQESQDIDLDDIVPAPTLASLCAGLVAIDQHGDFRFAHQTVSEYLRVSHRDRLSDADTSFANSCLTYLMYTTFASGPCAELDAFEGRLSQYPLYSYCSRYWYKQLNEIPNAEQKRLALKFFGSGPHWRSARQAARPIESEPEDFLTPQHLRGETTLHYAAYLDAHHLFEHLLKENPLALNKQNELGRTPLMEAVVSGSLKFASKLIKAGAKTNVADTDGKTALHLAGWVENLAMVDLLVTNPSVDVNLRVAKTSNLSSGDTALTRAARDGAGGIVRRLIEAGADVNAFNDTGFSALHMAAMNGNLQIVEILVNTPQIDINSLSRKSRFSVGDASAVTMAAWGGHAETVKELLKAGADPGDEALYLAVMRGNAAVVEALLQFNAEIDILRESSAFENDCLSILMIAILGKSMQILKALLSKGRPNINLQSRKGKTALMVAMKAKKIETARLLLSHEVINVNLADDDGWTPLMVAADTGLSEIVPELVAKGANVNAQSNAGWTPILLAAKSNHVEVARMLLSFDCIAVNTVVELHGRTALHYAVSWANATLVELLLFKRADLQIRDKANGLRAVDYALYFNDNDILDLLEASGREGSKHKMRNG